MAHTKEKETQPHVKLIIKLHATSPSMPRKQLVLYIPRSPKQKREPSEPSSSDTRCNKRCKVMASHVEYCSGTKIETTRAVTAKDSTTVHREVAKTRMVASDHEISSYPTKSGGTSDKCGGFVKENWRISKTGCEDKEKKKPPTMRVVTKDSRFVSKQKCERKEGVDNSCSKKIMKMRKVSTDEVSAINTDQYPTKSSIQCSGVVKDKERVGSRIAGKKKEEKKARVVSLMDQCKKMQCWVMLKRLMTGRDSWVFKQPMMGLEILDNNHSVVDHHHESKSVSKPFIKSEVVYNETTMKPIDLKDIEFKLKKWLYTDADEFADDIRVVFSYGLLHPPRNEIYKITRRLSEDFEITWQSLKDKWLSEQRKGRKKI